MKKWKQHRMTLGITIIFSLLAASMSGHAELSSTVANQDGNTSYGNWYKKELESSSKNAPKKFAEFSHEITSEDLKNLKEYISDTQFSGVVYLSDEKCIYKICSDQFEGIEEDALIFAIHSIGKVYTEILSLIMIQEGILAESTLFASVEMDSFSLQSLPLSVQNHMRSTTLYHTMIHKGGFGDYLGNYISYIRKSLENQKVPEILHTPEDFLTFSDPEIFELKPDEMRYSNLGILLVGLSLQHHYQKIEPINYNAILERHILNKAEIKHFFNSKPNDAYFNESDPIAGYICGSPAGGYWTTAKDLHKFGQWIRKKCTEEPDFMKLVEKYGQEFYSEKNKEIAHGGGIPSSSAFFSVFLDNGITIVIASNETKPRSSQIYDAIVRNMLSEKLGD